MKALTIWQPWASLIMIGAKPFEFRRWFAPAAIVGQRIVIHAGARPVKLDEVRGLILNCQRGGTGTGLHIDFALPFLERLLSRNGQDVLGHGLGTAVLGRPRRATEIFSGKVADSDRIDHHIVAWPLTEIEPFTPPVPRRGAQGFWDWGA